MTKQAGVFGDLPGIREGHEFLNRLELTASGVHRPTRAGIGARSGAGAESIVLSGMYEDDQDHGHVILYTGQGGRSSSSGEQVADQTLTGANLQLSRSCTQQLPIRVIRRVAATGGHFYRYDGLYRITSYWQETGKPGHQIWRFRLDKLVAAETNANSSRSI